MSIKGKRFMFARTLLCVSTAVVAPWAQGAFAQEAQAGNQGLADIVVTAQKVEQKLQEVPISVTALSTQDIQNQQVQSFADLDGLAPNLFVENAGSGSAPAITMRGIIGSNAALGVDSGIALYVDGVYMSRTTGAAFDIADIERIEILRGPQGTLFGRNSTGGAINYITRGPKGEFYFRQDFTVGSLGRFRSRTTLDLPAFGAFSVSATYLHDEEQGWVRNTQAGQKWDFTNATDGRVSGVRTSPKLLGSRNVDAGRVAVRFAPEQIPLTVDYRFDITRSNSTPQATQAVSYDAGALGGYAQGVYLSQPAVGGEGFMSFKPVGAVPNGFTTPEKLNAFGHNLTAAYDISDALQFKSITGYRGFTNSFSNEIDGVGGLIDPPPPLGTASGLPFKLLAIVQYERYRAFSQEFQLAYTSDFADIIGGAYYYREKVINTSPSWFLQTVTPVLSSGLYPNGPAQDSDGTARNKSYAAFGQATVHLTEQLDVTGGVRYTKDIRDTESRTFFFGQAVPSFHGKFDHVDWAASIAYRPTEDINLYGRFATGYQSGGIFNGFTFDPEEVQQFEIGAKTDLLDRRLRLNLSAFTIKYTNHITGTVLNGIYAYANADDRRLKGVEAEVTAIPIPNLTLGAQYGYVTGKITKVLDQQFAPTDPDQDVAGGPNHNVSLTGAYVIPDIGSGMDLSFDVSARWRSKLRVSGSLTPDAFTALAENSYWDVNARATLAKIPMSGAKGRLSAWVRNLLDKEKPIHLNSLGTVITANYSKPRTYGLDLSVEF